MSLQSSCDNDDGDLDDDADDDAGTAAADDDDHDGARLHSALPHHHPGQTNTKIAAGSCIRVDDGLKMDL